MNEKDNYLKNAKLSTEQKPNIATLPTLLGVIKVADRTRLRTGAVVRSELCGTATAVCRGVRRCRWRRSFR